MLHGPRIGDQRVFKQEAHIILAGDGAFLLAQRDRRAQAHLRDALRLGAADRRQGIAHGRHVARPGGQAGNERAVAVVVWIGEQVRDRLRPDIALRAIAQPVANGEGLAGVECGLVLDRAGAQRGASVVANVEDEILAIGIEDFLDHLP